MLVLSRKENEKLRVGESIVLTIVEVNGERVKVGIEAPMDVAIVRDEIAKSVGEQVESKNETAEESKSEIQIIEIPLARLMKKQEKQSGQGNQVKHRSSKKAA